MPTTPQKEDRLKSAGLIKDVIEKLCDKDFSKGLTDMKAVQAVIRHALVLAKRLDVDITPEQKDALLKLYKATAVANLIKTVAGGQGSPQKKHTRTSKRGKMFVAGKGQMKPTDPIGKLAEKARKHGLLVEQNKHNGYIVITGGKDGRWMIDSLEEAEQYIDALDEKGTGSSKPRSFQFTKLKSDPESWYNKPTMLGHRIYREHVDMLEHAASFAKDDLGKFLIQNNVDFEQTDWSHFNRRWDKKAIGNLQYVVRHTQKYTPNELLRYLNGKEGMFKSPLYHVLEYLAYNKNYNQLLEDYAYDVIFLGGSKQTAEKRLDRLYEHDKSFVKFPLPGFVAKSFRK